ncbi:hypothetical protein RISK_000240 [Rhodopirellula islandica]|uniref:Uncharacterized protein n=1 Tax=Rhodopirellula islandica TaxID=595434 RepID=A0A0J1BMN9_RHOIS|nr:hypothetical protein RISK_000240 [Rhodopirellula islandica]
MNSSRPTKRNGKHAQCVSGRAKRNSHRQGNQTSNLRPIAEERLLGSRGSIANSMKTGLTRSPRPVVDSVVWSIAMQNDR